MADDLWTRAASGTLFSSDSTFEDIVDAIALTMVPGGYLVAGVGEVIQMDAQSRAAAAKERAQQTKVAAQQALIAKNAAEAKAKTLKLQAQAERQKLKAEEELLRRQEKADAKAAEQAQKAAARATATAGASVGYEPSSGYEPSVSWSDQASVIVTARNWLTSTPGLIVGGLALVGIIYYAAKRKK